MKINCLNNNSRISFKAIYNEDQQKAFMLEAQRASENSNCFVKKVGAAIVSEDNIVVSTGYNAPPAYVMNPCEISKECPRKKYKVPSGTLYDCTHQNVDAEARALLNAGTKAKNGTLFLFGHYHLCDPCARLSLAAEIADFYIQDAVGEVIKHISRLSLSQSLTESFQKKFVRFVLK